MGKGGRFGKSADVGVIFFTLKEREIEWRVPHVVDRVRRAGRGRREVLR
jgi:hypothetical protein